MERKTKPEIQVDIKPTGVESAIVHAPFDKAKEALESSGYRIISLGNNARLRIQQGEAAGVSRNGNWTREGVLYVPGKGRFLTKASPIMSNPKEATDAHRKGKDYFLTDEQVEQSLADSVQLSVENIPTNRFAENPITVYAFGNIAEQYGQFLKEAGINEMPVWLVDLQDKPFARQMWFRDLDYWSDLLGDGRGLHDDYGMRGVKEGAEGTSPNFETYTLMQIADATIRLGLSPSIGANLLSKLKQGETK